MKSKQFYRYVGIILIILPFLGLYQYLKNSVYIILGIILVISSKSVMTSVKTNIRAIAKRPAIRRYSENVDQPLKEKEL